MAKLSVRRLLSRTPRENKTLNPEMRKLLNSYEPLHPEAQPADERGPSESRKQDETDRAA